MSNQEEGEQARTPANEPQQDWVLIRYIKTKFQERSAKKKEESASDRAARSTAYATWIIAIFAGVTVAVGYAQWCALRSTDEKIGHQVEAMGRQLSLMEADQRPWVYAEGAIPRSGFIIGDKKAEISLQFTVFNTGKSPGQFVNVGGDFSWISINSDADIQKIYDKRAICDDLRDKKIAGNTVFPAQRTFISHLFGMEETNLSEWRGKQPSQRGGLWLVGCVDYVFSIGGGHHQSSFIYQLNRPRPNNTFLPVDPVVGEIPANQLVLADNPVLAKNAD